MTPRTSAPCSASVTAGPPANPSSTPGCAARTRALIIESSPIRRRSASTSVAMNAVRIAITCVRPSALTYAERASIASASRRLARRRSSSRRRLGRAGAGAGGRGQEINEQRVGAGLGLGDVAGEGGARLAQLAERHEQVAVRADELAHVGVVGVDPLDQRSIDRGRGGGGLARGHLARGGVRRPDDHQHHVLRRHPPRERLGAAHRRSVLRQRGRRGPRRREGGRPRGTRPPGRRARSPRAPRACGAPASRRTGSIENACARATASRMPRHG